MSLAQLFYLKETFRENLRRWRRSQVSSSKLQVARGRTAFPSETRNSKLETRDSITRSASRFTLEALEPRVLLSATPMDLSAEHPLEPAAVTVPHGNLPSLDVDLNGQADALSDGIVIIRHLFGFTGAALTNGAVDPLGQRTDPAAIANYLESIRPSLDVDLNQQADALSDGIMIIRSLFGFTGAALTSGAIDSGGSRTDPAAIATFLDNLNPQREQLAPQVTAGLQQDTGLSSTDTITFNPTITGTVTDLNPIVSFTAGFDATPTASFTNVLGDLQTNGTFGLSTARLDQIAGGTLTDGFHTLHLRLTDANGNLTTLDRAFTLDTTAPVSPTFDLAVTSDTGTLGDQQTTVGIVTLKGQTDPSTRLQLLTPNTTTLSNGTGTFQLPDIALAVGANAFTLRASDLAGNQSDFSRTITRLAATQQADVVLTWNQITLDAIQRDATAPPVASRGLAMVSLAMYDAINAVEGTPGYYVSLPAQAGTDPTAAAAAAAYRVLSYLYPGQQALFDTQLSNSLAAIPNGPGKTNGVALGQSIADAIIAIRATDGWNDFVDYVPGNQPGDWQLTAPMFDVALLPQWADLTPFALTSPDQFRPAGPPALTSAAYTTAFNEVKALGSATNSTRTADQTEIARFWADGAGTATPPGHWNQIAEQIALQQGNSLSANARLFAELNVALADAGITAWNTKYDYQFWRPITAIQQADLDGNANTTADPNWTSLLITPPFPEYISGHSTFSGAAAEILTSLFGANVGFSTTSLSLPNVTRTFTSFEQAAQEAGRSRIYGGIHFEFSNQDGLTAGKSLADFVLNRFTVTTDTQGPKILLTQQSGTVTKTNLTLTGQVLDNLAGVAELQAKLDNGTFTPVTFNTTGTFTFNTTLLLDGTQDGQHTITFQAQDNQHNFSTLAFTFTLDTKVPVITLTSPADNATLAVGTRLTGTADATGSKLVELCYKFDNGTLVPVSFDPTIGSFDLPLDLSKLATGAHTLSLRAQDQAGNVTIVTKNVTLAAPIPLTIIEVTPATGASDVGTTFRPQVFFSRPINVATLNANNFYATDSTGTKLAATIVPSQDGTFAWLFFTNPMPGASTITLHVDGTTILAAGDGQALDADGNGTPGGLFTSTFSTVSLVPLAGTTLSGRVLDPGPDLKMGTFDDIRAGADGILHTADDLYLNPLAGVKVHIIGLENQAVFTDVQGNFSFNAVPSGDIKLAVDGRTATNAPAGFYFPEMVMDLQVEVGQANTVMGTMGTREEKAANLTRPEVYLPRLQTSILQTVSDTVPTIIRATAESAPNLTEEQRQYLTLEVLPGSLLGPDGQPVINGQVGISTVPPELVRDMLPPGLLQHTFDVTIQAPGVVAFATPLKFTFPNVFNLAPGTTSNFLSFDHTTGRLVIEGTATVSQDGKYVTTDPGTGITKPGWHGGPPPGVQVKGKVEIGKAPPCNYFGILGDASLIGLGIALAAGPSLPFAIAGVAVGVGATAYNLYQNYSNFDPTSINDVLDGGFGIGGFWAASPRDPLQPIQPGYIPKDPILRDQLVRQLNPISQRIGNFASVAGKFTGLLGSLLGGISLGSKLNDCLQTASILSLSSEHSHFVEGSLLDSSAMEAYVDEIGRTATPGMTALYEIIGNKLRPLLPSDRSIILVSESGYLRGVELNGDPYLDPRGRGPFRVPFSEIVDDGFGTDLRFREALLEISNSFSSFATTFSSSSQSYTVALEQLRGMATASDQFYSSLEREAPSSSVMYQLIDALSGQIIASGETSPAGTFEFFAPENASLRLTIFDQSTLSYAETSFLTPRSGVDAQGIARSLKAASGEGILLALPDKSLDSDRDGLGDASEMVIGTSRLNSDTDRDGLSDLAEVKQGLDPLGGRTLQTGMVAGVLLQGVAREVVLEGAIANPEQLRAYLAIGLYGLALVDASQFQRPVVLSQLDLPGDATDVSVDSQLGIAVVASNAGGLHFVDVTNPAAPTLVRTIAINPSQIEVFDGFAYVTVGTELRSYNVATGELIQGVTLGIGSLVGLAREGNVLYTTDSDGVLRATSIVAGALTPLGSLPISLQFNESLGKIFVGNGTAYIGAEGSFTGGFVTVDVSNPDGMTLLSGVDGAGIAGKRIVANGSGLGVSVGRPGGAFGPNVLDVVSLTDPTNTNNFITRFTLPAEPFSVAIGAGIAFVADGTGGLQVVNYRSFDNQGVAPTVSITSPVIDVDPVTPGIQVIAGSSIPVRVNATDDVQVRNVEMLVNGVVVSNDVSFPFELSAIALGTTTSTTTTTVQVRATDTGGNIALSNLLTFQLVPDTFAPTLVRTNIPSGTVHDRSFKTVQVQFSEALDANTVTAQNFMVLGPNGQPITPTVVALVGGATIVQLSYPLLDVGINQLVIKAAAVTDRAGNALGSQDVVIPFEIVSHLVPPLQAISPAGGLVFGQQLVGNLAGPSSVEVFTFSVEAGQKLTVSITPDSATLRARLEVVNAGGQVLASVDGAGAGATVALSAVPAAPPGIYRIRVTSLAGSGDLRGFVLLNTVMEPELIGGPSNDTIATATLMAPSSVPLQGQADRLAAVGFPTGGDDFYRLDLAQNQVASLVLSDLGFSGGTNWEFDLRDAAGTRLAMGVPNVNSQGFNTGNVVQTITEFKAPQTGAYYVRVHGDSKNFYSPLTGAPSYLLVATRGAAVDLELNDANLVSLPQPIVLTGYVLGSVGDRTLYPFNFGPTQDAVDDFTIQVTAGDLLRITTTTPGTGVGEPDNNLVPLLQLFNPTGDFLATDSNGAADGRNAQINLTAPVTGTYRVRIAPISGAGDYTLLVEGATGTNPASLAVSQSSFTTRGTEASLTLGFTSPLLLTTVQAGDATVNGVAASSVSVLDASTIRFIFNGITSSSSYQAVLGAGAVQGLRQEATAAFTRTFTGDTTAPVVISSSLTPLTLVPPSDPNNVNNVQPFVVTVTFSEALDTSVLDPSDMGIQVADDNFQFLLQPNQWSFTPSTNQLVMEFLWFFSSTSNSHYSLRLVSGPSGFRDLAGNPLDGSPSFPFPSGQVDSGTDDFVVEFGVGTPTPVFTAQREGPAGSLIFGGDDVTSVFGVSGETDSWLLPLAAGQRLSAALFPSSTIQGRLTIFDPNGVKIGTIDGTAVGRNAVLLNLPVAVSGTYRLDATSLSGAGLYRVEFLLNADVDVEDPVLAAGSNDTLATAQSIQGSAIPLQGTADRLAVEGKWSTAFDADVYSFQLKAGQSTTFVLDEGLTGTPNPNQLAPQIELLDANGNKLAATRQLQQDKTIRIENFVAPQSGTYFARLSSGVDANNYVYDKDYQLVVFRGGTLEQTLPDTTAQDIAATSQVVGNISKAGSGAGGAIRVAVLGGLGAFNLAAQLNDDTFANFDAVVVSALDIDMVTELEQFNVVVIGDPDSRVALEGTVEMALTTWWSQDGGGIVGTGGLLTAAGPTTGQTLSLLDGLMPVDINGGAFQVDGFTLQFGSVAHDVTRGLADFPVLGPAELPVGDVDLTVGFTPPVGLGTILDRPAVAIMTNPFGDSIRSAYLAPMYFDQTAAGLRSGSADRLLEQAVAWASGIDFFDSYSVQAKAGDQLVFTTTTPFGGTGLPGNLLDPRIELLNSAGTVVASNDNGAPDGKNALLNYTVPVGGAGQYTIRVRGLQTGEYTLAVTGATGIASLSSTSGTSAPVSTVGTDLGISDALAYVQASWVSNFVTNGATSNTSTKDEDLLIALPG